MEKFTHMKKFSKKLRNGLQNRMDGYSAERIYSNLSLSFFWMGQEVRLFFCRQSG